MSETRILASYVVNGTLAGIPQNVLHEAHRSLVNFMGCAIGGAATRPWMSPCARLVGRSGRARGFGRVLERA